MIRTAAAGVECVGNVGASLELRDIRKNYQGPLALSQDLMVFNVTRDEIRTRLAITPTLVWPNKEHHDQFRAASRKKRPTMSRWLADAQLFPKF